MGVEIAVVAIAGATVTHHESIFNGVRQKSFSHSRDATVMPFTSTIIMPIICLLYHVRTYENIFQTLQRMYLKIY